MGARVVFFSTEKSENRALNRCYQLAESGKEIQVTRDMLHLAYQQILARCKK